MAVTKPVKAAPKASTAVSRAKVDLPVDIHKQMEAEVAALQKRLSAPSGNRINVTQSKTFKMPSGLETDDPIECVVVEFSAAYYYYEDAYDRNNVVPPKCFALGLEPAGMSPDDSAQEKQAGSCSACWANQFGSAGKGKACQNARLLALLPPDADAETPLMIIKVSPTGIRAFDGYVSAIARTYQAPVRAVVTEISFDENSEWPSLRFKAIGPANKNLLLLAQDRKQEAQDLLLTPPEYSAAEAPAKKATARKPAAKKPAVAGRR